MLLSGIASCISAQSASCPKCGPLTLKGDTPHKRGVSGDPPRSPSRVRAIRAISLRVLAGALVFKLKKRGDGTVTWVAWGL